MNTKYKEALDIHYFISPKEKTECQKVEATAKNHVVPSGARYKPARPECRAYCSAFGLTALAQPLLGNHKPGHRRLLLQMGLGVAREIPLGPARYLTKSEHLWSSVSAPLWLNHNMLTLPGLTPDCFLCRVSQLSPPDPRLYSDSN